MSSELRDFLRGQILSGEHTKRKRYPYSFFGQDIEIVQPSVKDVEKLTAQKTAGEFNLSLIDILIDYAYVPGSNERVFEAADRTSLEQLPFGPDMVALTDLLGDLLGGSIKDKEKN